ncbi:MAG: DUF3592 domain-containing protein [Bacteroidales bacterium]|nr:DUF3592 domain-containing protein [Bacteroidales bacterium]
MNSIDMTTGYVGWLLSIIVLVLICLFGYILQNSVSLLIRGKKAQGIVVGMENSSSSSTDILKAPLLTPLVEFVTSDGEHIKISGQLYTSKSSPQIGDIINVAYQPSNPKNAQLMLWKEFPLVPAGFVLGFTIVLILMWMGGILISNDLRLDDPLHLLPKLIAHFHLNPVRFPVLIILFFAIPACVLGTYVTSQRGIEMRKNGIKTIGFVTGFERVYSKTNDGETISGEFPLITYKDKSGNSYNIHASTTKTFSRLKTGDKVAIIYRANYPNKGVVNTWSEFWIPPLFFGFVTIALLFLLFLVLSGHQRIVPVTGDPEIYTELKTSGVSAIATVIKANPKTRHLHYRIELDTRKATPELADFVALESEFAFWIPPATGEEIKKGDQFRAYLDSLKPFKEFYIDFSQRLGFDQNVKSFDEEAAIEDEAEKVIILKLVNLLRTCSAYLSAENLSEIKGLIKENNLSLAFERLVILIMDSTRPHPLPLLKLDWNDILELGIKLDINELSEDEPGFWEKFLKFKTGQNQSIEDCLQNFSNNSILLRNNLTARK